MAAIPGPTGPTPPQPDPTDLSREQVIDIFRTVESDALRRHTALVGSDGAGTIYVVCGCELQFNLAAWEKHLRAIAITARKPRPQPKR